MKMKNIIFIILALVIGVAETLGQTYLPNSSATLVNGTIYTATTKTINGTLTVPDYGTVTIYIPTGVTLTINGANVIADENIPWYGFNYLLSNYGAGAAVTATVPTTPDVAAVPVSAYTILSGDTLTGIASKLGSSVEALAAFNGINNVDLIYAGNTIFYC